MGLGSTAKKLQKVTDVAEQMYGRINDLREEVDEMRVTVRETNEAVQGTSDRVERLESEMAEQRALLDEIARQQGVDVEAVSASSHIVDAEDAADGDSEEAAGGEADDD